MFKFWPKSRWFPEVFVHSSGKPRRQTDRYNRVHIFKMSSQGGRRGSPSQVENSQPWRMQTPSPQTPCETEVVVLSGASSPGVPSPAVSFELPSRVRHHGPSPGWGGAKASPGANDRVRALSSQPSPRRSPRLVRCVVEDEADSDDDGGVAGMFSSAQQKTAVRGAAVWRYNRSSFQLALGAHRGAVVGTPAGSCGEEKAGEDGGEARVF